MSWLNGLSDDEKREMFDDSSAAFSVDLINEKEYRATLIKLGYNATDIEDCVKQYRPDEPELDL